MFQARLQLRTHVTGRGHLLLGRTLTVVRAHVRVAQRRADIGVPGQNHLPTDIVDRPLGQQLGVQRVRVRHHRRVDEHVNDRRTGVGQPRDVLHLGTRIQPLLDQIAHGEHPSVNLWTIGVSIFTSVTSTTGRVNGWTGSAEQAVHGVDDATRSVVDS